MKKLAIVAALLFAFGTISFAQDKGKKTETKKTEKKAAKKTDKKADKKAAK